MTSLGSCNGAGFTASTTIAFTGSSLPTGLVVSQDFVAANDNAPYNHVFVPSNVLVKDDFLQLVVPGGQSGPNISAAEVFTGFQVRYASVCTYAVLTNTAGVCNGMFLYKSDRQETDIEWLSDSKSQANVFSPLNSGTNTSTTNTTSTNTQRFMQYTNQALNGNRSDSTVSWGYAPEDATTSVHEYRLDWMPQTTRYYIDGKLQAENSQNVPTEGGPWTWNNWVNGDPNWTGVNAPSEDAVFKIQKIVMYYNSTDSTPTANTAPQNSSTTTPAGKSSAFKVTLDSCMRWLVVGAIGISLTM